MESFLYWALYNTLLTVFFLSPEVDVKVLPSGWGGGAVSGLLWGCDWF